MSIRSKGIEYKSIPISLYIKECLKEGVDFTQEHWVADKEIASKLMKFYKALIKKTLRLDFNIVLKKVCKVENCCNPDCHRIMLMSNSEKEMSTTEIEELCEEIDFDRLAFLGYSEFLKEYNEEHGDFLKISMKELKSAVACHIKKKSEEKND